MFKKLAVVLAVFSIALLLLSANGSVFILWRRPGYGSVASSGVFLVVALDGSGDFTDIQKAINAVPQGSTAVITIKEGIYDLNPRMTYPYKSVVVRSNLTIRGIGIDRTIIRSFPTKQLAGSDIRAPSVTSSSDVSNLLIQNLTVVQNGTPDNMGWGAIDLRGGTNENVTIRDIKVTDITGAAISARDFRNLVIENCIIERAWTGIALGGGSIGLVKGNRLINMSGDGIFPQSLQSVGFSVSDVVIVGNYMENIGDTGIDITAASPMNPHERITALNNTLKNAIVRVSYSQHIKILNNTITRGFIDVDNGAGSVIDVIVEGNRINSSREVAIGFYGVRDCAAIKNVIQMTGGTSVQSGIHAAIRGTALIERNIIKGARNYGISFGGWGLGTDTDLTIRGNLIQDFGEIGIWDDDLRQGPPVLVENNTVFDSHSPFVSQYGVRTDETSNSWTIRYNIICAGAISPISAPSSNIYGNTFERP